MTFLVIFIPNVDSLPSGLGNARRRVEPGNIVFKNLIRPLVAGAGITTALAALNQRLRATAELPRNRTGGTQRRWKWRGYDIFVTEAGVGEPVLLVHGIYAGASSFEFRHLFASLARHRRVVAFDLLGCGLSDRPNLEYSAELFVEQIVDAVGEFGTARTTLVGSSLGGAYAIRAAARLNDSLAGLVAICPTGLCGVLDNEHAPMRALIETIRAPLAGEAFFNALAARPTIRWFLQRQAYANPAFATEDTIDHYYALTHQPGSRFVPAYFVGQGLNCNVERDLPFVDAPVLVLWGEKAGKISPVTNAREFAKLAKSAQVELFPESAVLPHEEEPEAVAAAIERFVAAHVGAGSERA